MANISASSYGRFRTCPRMYYFTNVLGLVRVRQEGARAFGTMYHAGLEEWWRAMDGGDTPWRDADAALVAASKGIAKHAAHANTDQFERACAEAMIEAYHFRYFELDFESVSLGDGVEEEFDVELRDADDKTVPGWRVVGRRDACKKFNDGRIKIVEHKHTSQEIHGASDYWGRLKFDTQVSIYVDSAQKLGLKVDEALYDASRRPDIRPLLKTPEEKRRVSKGKGCPHCGGRKGGKLGVAAGTGRIMVRTSVDGDGLKLAAPMDVETECTSCAGTGWHEAPKLDGRQRTEDESIEDYKTRIKEEIADDPNKHFRMGSVPRTREQLAEARQDLVVTTGEIGTLLNWARAESPHDMRNVRARRCFPRNDGACMNQYGRKCDYLLVCSGAENPFESPHYQIRTRTNA